MQKTHFKTYSSREELENARALEAAQLSYTERFYILMRLIKIATMIKNAKIVHAPNLKTSS
jgi:hypothetical protein